VVWVQVKAAVDLRLHVDVGVGVGAPRFRHGTDVLVVFEVTATVCLLRGALCRHSGFQNYYSTIEHPTVQTLNLMHSLLNDCLLLQSKKKK
jgi:hypothetical protein